MNYYQANKERILKYQKEYYYRNIQRYKLYNHIYYMSIRKPKIQANRPEKPKPAPKPKKTQPKPKAREQKPKTVKNRQFLNDSLVLTFD